MVSYSGQLSGLVQAVFRELLSLLDPLALSIVVREIIIATGHQTWIASTHALFGFAAALPVMHFLNEMGFNPKTINQMVIDSVERVWGKYQDNIAIKDMFYQLLKLSVSVGGFSGAIKLREPVASWFGDVPTADAYLSEFAANMFMGLVCQKFITDSFDFVARKAIRKLNRNSFFSDGSNQYASIIGDGNNKKFLKTPTDDEVPEKYLGDDEKQTQNEQGELEDDYAAVKQSRCRCIIV